MSFWDLSDGGSAKDTGTGYEIPVGNMEPIPAGSSVLAAPDEVKWETKTTGERFISLRWSVLSPEEYKNRKVFHKLWVTDLDPGSKDEAKGIAKRDKAKRMLAAIDANAGGKLSKLDRLPTDDDLALALIGKPMIATLQVWEINGSNGTATGNWVCAVAPKSAGIDVKPPSAKPKAAPRDDGFGSAARSPRPADLDDEIPF